MKAIIILTISFCLSGFTNDRYEKSMQKTIESLYEAEDIITLQEAANKFNRIAAAEEDEWLPRYYSALAYTWMATREEETVKKDQWLDQAQNMVEKAMELSGHSEIIALQGFIYMIRVSVDPATRGATLSQKAFLEFGKALNLDPNNPRALFFKGQMEYGVAQFFKSDTSPACETMSRSLEIFDTFTPESVIHPNWGGGYARRTVEHCKNN